MSGFDLQAAQAISEEIDGGESVAETVTEPKAGPEIDEGAGRDLELPFGQHPDDIVDDGGDGAGEDDQDGGDHESKRERSSHVAREEHENIQRALRSERESARTLTQENKALRDLVTRIANQQQQQPAPSGAEDNRFDPRTVIPSFPDLGQLAELRRTDPGKAFDLMQEAVFDLVDHTVKTERTRHETELERQQQQQQQEAASRERAQIAEAVTRAEQEVRERDPHYDEMVDYIITTEAVSIAAMQGVTEAQAKAEATRRLGLEAMRLVKGGRDPINTMYQVAKARGFAPKPRDEGGKPRVDLAKVKEGRAALGAIPAGGKPPRKSASLHTIATAKGPELQQEINAYLARMRAG